MYEQIKNVRNFNAVNQIYIVANEAFLSHLNKMYNIKLLDYHK